MLWIRVLQMFSPSVWWQLLQNRVKALVRRHALRRNGRLRRVGSWAAVTRKPTRYAYPAYRGTRDHRLVHIMRKRIDTFSLLLGGVQDLNVGEVVSAEEKWRNEVMAFEKNGCRKRATA